MIKRWIARRRRRIDLFGRMGRVEDRLGQVEARLSEAQAAAERHVPALQHAFSKLERAGQTANERLELFEARHTENLHDVESRLDTLANEMEGIGRRSREAIEKLKQASQDHGAAQVDLVAKLSDAEAAVRQISVRAARLETQRQLDGEEHRRLITATIQELKRAVLHWRGTVDALADIDRVLPAHHYAGRPWEERPAARLQPNLQAGISIESSGLFGKLYLAPLNEDGSPGEAACPPKLEADTWIVFAPAGAVAAPNFSNIVLEHVARFPEADLFYADDLAVETEEAVNQLRLKPAFDITLLSAQDYIGAPIIIRSDVLGQLGGLDAAMGTAACSDLLFRAYEKGLSIQRIPEVLLAHPGRRVVATSVDYRRMLEAQASLAPYDVRPGRVLDTFKLQRRFTTENAPAVSLLIPTRGSTPPGAKETFIDRLLLSLAAVDWPMDKLTVIVGDDQPVAPDWASRAWPFALKRLETLRPVDEPFNYAAKMNLLWRAAETEQIVFMNDDVRAVDGDWLRALQTFALDPKVGGVGARLLFEDGSLQHAGMAPHGAGTAHLWVQRLGSQGVYQNWPLVHREWSMVTGAVFATRRSAMEQVSGFDERFSLEFNDTDLSMRLRKAGYRIVYTPFAQMVHVERASRGGTPPPKDEEALFYARWGEWLANDPSWHPQLDRGRVEVMPVADPHAWYL